MKSDLLNKDFKFYFIDCDYSQLKSDLIEFVNHLSKREINLLRNFNFREL